MANKKYTVNWNETTTPLRGITSLCTDNYAKNELVFNINENGYLVVTNTAAQSVTFANYSSLSYLYDNTGAKYNLISEGLIYNYNNPITLSKKGKITGTKYSDKIIGTEEKDKISAGNGNDIIYSSHGNDTIAGGAGKNTVIYSGKFDTDSITLTSKEQLELNLEAYEPENLNINFKVQSKDLILDIYVNEELYGTIRLKKFGSKNIVGGNGSVTLKLKATEPIDLNTFDLLTYDDFSEKGVFKGSRFSEQINAENAERNISINGGAGYNTIIGTDGYNDTITGGNDGNEISAKNGNKTITTGSGADIIKIIGDGTHTIKAGNGKNDIKIIGDGINKITTGKNDDTIFIGGNSQKTTLNLGAGENTITIDNSGSFGNIVITEQKVSAVNIIEFTETIDTTYSLYKDKNDLQIIKNDDLSFITLKNYFSAPKKHAEYKFIVDGNTLSIDEFMALTDWFYVYGKKTINGTNYNDTILADDSIVRTNIYNDTIKPGKGKDIINAGLGNNKIYLYKGDGEKTILDGKGSDTLVFSAGTSLNFDYKDNDLMICYGEANDIVTISNYANSSVKYIQIGKTIKNISFYANSLSSGDSAKNISISDRVQTELILNNRLNNKEYRYTLQSKNGEQDIRIEYLTNGRLVITGDNIEINAYSNQEDDIILLGNNNRLNTGDCDDIVRLGHSLDSASDYYHLISDNNIINTGAGNDHITYLGYDNNIDAGEGYDTVLSVFWEYDISKDTILNSEASRAMDDINYKTLNYQVDGFTQGDGGGDCRLLALLKSISLNCNYNSLEDYVTITESDDSYSLTFKNYTEGTNNVVITKDELSNFCNVYGDIDVVLIDCGLNKLLEDKGTTVADADFEEFSKYFFGNNLITYTDSRYDEKDKYSYIDRLYEQWELYKNGEITNITFGINSRTPNRKLGIVQGHAYTIKDLNDGIITLINPWDSEDKLTLSLTDLYSYTPSVISYGFNYYNENYINDKSSQEAVLPNLNEISENISSWISTSNGATSTDIEYFYQENEAPIITFANT